MNTERLHAITIEVLNDIKNTNTQSILQQLVKALQNQVNQPQTSEFQQQVSTHLTTLYTSLKNSHSNDFSPAWKQALQELGLNDLLGTSLHNRIKGIFERNKITPSVALQEIQDINKQFSTSKTSLEQIVSSFEVLKIGSEELKPGQCEIGILVPRLAINNKLSDFAIDLEEIDKIFGTFSELTTGARPGFNIRSVSSSDLSVFLDMLPVVAAGIAIAVERIVGLYKQILEIRKLHGELKEKGVPKKDLKGVMNHANTIMEKGIEQLVKDLLKKYYKNNDDGRRNELSIELRFSLNKIAKRIDKGYSVEVRVKPLSEGKDDIKKGEVTHKDTVHFQDILSASKNIEFIKLEGEPILTLPESLKKQKGEMKKK
jgi:biotin-(acetyl-CoA carboxylase) ligase